VYKQAHVERLPTLPHVLLVFEWPPPSTLANIVATLQLQTMSKTSILITPCGGTGTILTFLPPGASAIVMNYWQSVAGRSEQMESLYYWNLEYLDIQYFPVLLEDYEQTKDRPACEKGQDEPYFEQQVGCCLVFE